ncbi:MAG: hypothetical protein WBO46_14965 [Caldilineaceae bacterium]
MADRKTARKALAALLLANVSDLVAVYDHETVDFGGRSPVAMIYSDGTAPGPAETFAAHARQHALMIALWWRRTDGAATEDYMDDLSAAVLTVLEANDETVNWDRLWVDDTFSETGYPILDGQMYRAEFIRVILW